MSVRGNDSSDSLAPQAETIVASRRVASVRTWDERARWLVVDLNFFWPAIVSAEARD